MPSTLDSQRSFLNGGGQMGALIRAHDWSRTPLGPSEEWPRSLKTAVRIMLTSRQPMWIGWGPDLIYLYNDPYLSILGGKHPKALGRPTAEVWPEIWREIGPMLATAMRGDQGTYVEAQRLIMERNGYPEETYYTFSYSPVPADDGSAGGIICANTDDTDRVIRERQLAVLRQLAAAGSEARDVASAARLASDALAQHATDVTFAILYLATAEGVFEQAAAVRVAAPAIAPARLDTTSDPDGLLQSILRRGEPVVVDAKRVLGDSQAAGSAPAVSQAVMLPLSRRGSAHPQGLLITGLNPLRLYDAEYEEFITSVGRHVQVALDNGRAYDEERRRAEALAELDRAKTAFFSNVSHEFRTPLTLMLGPTADALSSPARALQGDDLETVYRNQLRLMRLVNTLLEFSRLEAGRVTATFAPADLAAVTRDIASSFRSAIERAGVRFRIETDDIGDEAYIDAEMWERIVLNLLSNAFKYTHQGEIDVSLRRRGPNAELTVRDTGIGIPEDSLPHVFERFHRVEGAQGRTVEGSGIGLALVQELVRLHGGDVRVESALGRGSSFTVSIPLGRQHLPPTAIASEPRKVARSGVAAFVAEAERWTVDETAVAANSPAPHRSTEERILVADDNADMRAYLRRILEPFWRVDSVSNGREALDAVAARRPDLLITDVMMPELGGFELVQRLRDDPRTRDLPIVMLSARAGEEATVDGLAAGADDYLVKPFSSRELVARVESQLLRARVKAAEDRAIKRVSTVFRHAPVAVALLYGPDHTFELTNAAYQEIVGGRDVLGKPLREALPEVIDQGFVALLDDVYRSAKPFVGRAVPIALRSQDTEQTHYFDFVYQPLFDAEGQVEGIAAVGFDVTELARAREEAERANRAKDEFLAMLGHELRNPLAPILTALELMRMRNDAGSLRERSVIERQVRHMTSLVDDLLDISRITRGKLQLHKTDVEVSSIVADAVEMTAPLFEQGGQHLEVAAEPGIMVHVDAARIRQAVGNLLANAAKYTPSGGNVRVDVAAAGATVQIVVRDSGIGIEPEELSRIFDLFAQAPQSLERARGGLGLGLAIARSLAQMHGGSLSAASEGPGRGSTFTLALPRVFTGARADAAVDPAPETMASSRRVLVVDDNADAASMLEIGLQMSGFEVRVAHDGPSALALAREFKPEIALLDIGLPVMDGYELARRWKSDPVIAPARLIALTGYGQDRDRARSHAAGFEIHLVKPVDLATIRNVLAE